ncbi:MAG: ATP-dependent helicase HrpB, partial [Bacteroidales bacterium]|nr:ATP-dependent helicase HrpB [Bacteroidales bacterium]
MIPPTDLPIMEIAGAVNAALAEHPCLVVAAPPGAGKSTVLPLILQAKGKIVILEPRRLAARQIAERMAALLGEPVGRTVGYRIRFERRVSAATRIEVLTEGILTRMLVDDPALEGVGVVIFDEFHERSLQSDVALALTREAQQLLRPDLRIVLMSATIDTEALCAALGAPLLESRGRMFPVEVRHTPEEAGEMDVAERVAHWVRRALRDHEGDILAFLPGEAEIRRCAEMLEDVSAAAVYPLYGLLPPEEQRAAIAPSAPGRRKVVLATPIAETSLTIEGVRTVVDGGFCRRLVFDPQNALSRLETVRISRDMADQRSGRAGRVAPGVCYRLWSLATEARMAPTRVPEILEADLAGTVLDAAAWGESHIGQLPWITPPPPAHVAQATRLLTWLGALDESGRITPHGRDLSALPCHPRIAQMLLRAGEDTSLAADIAALLEEKDPLAAENDAALTTRLEALRRAGRNGRWGRIARIAEQYRQLASAPGSKSGPQRSRQAEKMGAGSKTGPERSREPYAVGALVGAAYPERIAKARPEGRGHFQLATGELAAVSPDDALAACEWLAVASVSVRPGGEGRI